MTPALMLLAEERRLHVRISTTSSVAAGLLTSVTPPRPHRAPTAPTRRAPAAQVSTPQR